VDKLKSIFFFFLICISLTVFAQIPLRGDNNKIVTDFIINHSQGQQYSIVSQEKILFENSKKISNYVFKLHPQGFVIVSADSKHILSYSFENNMVEEGSDHFEVLSSFINSIALEDDSSGLKSTENIEDESYGPYVHNLWGQVNCYDQSGQIINVTNLFTPHNYAAGCVAISQASIMKHYNWPPKGVGSRSYSDNSGSSRGTYSVDFGNENYDWENALDRYKGKTSSVAEREAAGKVAYHAAVSLRMDFEHYGSTSNVGDIPSALANYFRFTALYKGRSSSSFWSILDSNMVWARPVVLAIESSSGGGHSIVCDGLRIESGNYYYHLNMGWWGSSNGWYQIRGSFDASGYSRIVGAAMNILPEPLLETPVMFGNVNLGQLNWNYPEKGNADAFEVQNSVDGGNWVTLSNTIVDTNYTIAPQNPKNYKYRVRAMTNGRWYANSWSQEVKLNWVYEGTNEQTIDEVKIYPSSFSSDFNIYLPNNLTIPTQVLLYNLQGVLIFQKQVENEQKININASNWNSGIYIVHILYGKESQVSKIVKI
jgi:hypothetical protein